MGGILLPVLTLLIFATTAIAGPMRNGTRTFSRYPYNMIRQPGHLLHRRIPNPNMIPMRAGSRRNYDYIMGGQTVNVVPDDEPEDESDDEYDELDESDLFENVMDNENLNILHFNKIKDPRRYFIEEGEQDDENDVIDDEDDDEEDLDDVPINESAPCLDGNIEYSIGDEYISPSDACNRCTCTLNGPQCNAEVCPSLPDGCIELQKRPGECCPVCTRRGCPFGANNIYEIGSKFNYTDCDMCECMENGVVDCTVADCAPPPCVDAHHISGECCPVCPTVPNCYGAGAVVIPAGRWVAMARCALCKCREVADGTSYWLGHRQAQCKRDPRCGRNARHSLRKT